ncbi:GDSL family lipase [Sporolactobacillus sp. THM7-7]|nr:GDSL family lipase [Sporolactobacillus sp. THM7-7]
MLIKKNDVVLFQGDSITDVKRDHERPDDLGTGYPLMVAGYFGTMFPEMNVRFLNTAVGGDAVEDMAARWKKDCIDLKPDVVSILIGINDTWNHAGKETSESPAHFKEKYRRVLTGVSTQLDARIVIMEPYVLPYPEDRKAWREDLDPKIHTVRELAAEYQAVFVPLDGIMNSVCVRTGAKYLTGDDGVHPTSAGHGVIAKAWLDAVL